ncbi:MAG TPA: hypothetical protein VEG37_05365 [Burkholderiales bacterium]|nr:hypothetical protein [Burkholderiales bacterium]
MNIRPENPNLIHAAIKGIPQIRRNAWVLALKSEYRTSKLSDHLGRRSPSQAHQYRNFLGALVEATLTQLADQLFKWAATETHGWEE